MKKIFSAFLAVAMIASTMATAFAGTTLNATLSNNKTTKVLAAGDTVNVTVTLTDAEFANFEFGLNYDANAFTFVKGAKASSSNLDGAVVFGNPSTGYVTGVYANAVDETLVVEVEDEETGDVTEVAAKNTFYWQFKVTDTAYTGTYNFTLVQNDEQKRGTSSIANGALTTVLGEATSVSVENIAPPSDTVPATATFGEEKQEGTVYGLKGSIAANDQTVTGVAFKVNNGEKDGNVNATFTQAIAANSNVTFGVNIIGIPSGITLGYVADSLAPVAE